MRVLRPENHCFSTKLPKRPPSAMVRSTPLRRRNKAAYTELSTPLGRKVGVLLMKSQGDKKRVPTGLITELAAAYGCNSRTIRRIEAAFWAQISRPGAFDFHHRRQATAGGAPMLSTRCYRKCCPSCQSSGEQSGNWL